MNGPGVAFECTEQNGFAYLGRQRDRRDRRPGYLATGARGRGRRIGINHHQPGGDAPCLRYRTRDLLVSYRAIALCGRTHKRLARFKGRSDDMIILKGCEPVPHPNRKDIGAIQGIGQQLLDHPRKRSATATRC